MSTYLVIKNGTMTKSYTCKESASTPYLKVSNSYLPLTTQTGTGLHVKASGSTFIPQASYTTTTTEAGYSGVKSSYHLGESNSLMSRTNGGFAIHGSLTNSFYNRTTSGATSRYVTSSHSTISDLYREAINGYITLTFNSFEHNGIQVSTFNVTVIDYTQPAFADTVSTQYSSQTIYGISTGSTSRLSITELRTSTYTLDSTANPEYHVLIVSTAGTKVTSKSTSSYSNKRTTWSSTYSTGYLTTKRYITDSASDRQILSYTYEFTDASNTIRKINRTSSYINMIYNHLTNNNYTSNYSVTSGRFTISEFYSIYHSYTSFETQSNATISIPYTATKTITVE